jgi:hypothetical protein
VGVIGRLDKEKVKSKWLGSRGDPKIFNFRYIKETMSPSIHIVQNGKEEAEFPLWWGYRKGKLQEDPQAHTSRHATKINFRREMSLPHIKQVLGKGPLALTRLHSGEVERSQSRRGLSDTSNKNNHKKARHSISRIN